jgi:hypothetical protein
MSLDDVTGPRAIYERWIAVWPTLTAVPYVFEDAIADESVPYARLAVIPLGTVQHTMGENRKWENGGLITVKLTVPAGRGRKVLDELVGHVRTVFQGRRLAPSGGEPGVVTQGVNAERPYTVDGAHRVQVTSTPFYYYERR